MEATFPFPKNEKYLDFQNQKSPPLYIFRLVRISEQEIYRVLRDVIQCPIWCLRPHHNLIIKTLSGLRLSTACEREVTTSWHRSFCLEAQKILISLIARVIQMLNMQSQETDISRQRMSWVREYHVCHMCKQPAVRLPVMNSKSFMKDFYPDESFFWTEL